MILNLRILYFGDNFIQSAACLTACPWPRPGPVPVHWGDHEEESASASCARQEQRPRAEADLWADWRHACDHRGRGRGGDRTEGGECNGYLQGQTGTCEGRRISARADGYLWKQMGTCKGRWVPATADGYLWAQTGTCEGRWVPVRAGGYLWRQQWLSERVPAGVAVCTDLIMTYCTTLLNN